MRATIRRSLSMARRALDFATANPVSDSGFTTVLAALAADVEQGDALAVLHESGLDRQHSATARRSELQGEMHTLLRRLCTIAKRGAPAHPELREAFALPSKRLPIHNFVIKAQELLDTATANQALLVSLGIGDTFIAQLTQAIADSDAATTGAHSGRGDHVGANAQLDLIVTQCNSDVDVIDTFMLVAFANNPQVLAGWKSASSVAGPFTKAATPPDAPPPAPPQPVALVPAPGADNRAG